MTDKIEAAKVTSWRQLERNPDLAVTKWEAFKVALDLITVRRGFNPRDMYKPETQTKIANLKKAYINGDVVPPIQCHLLDNGTVEVVDGECRYTAALQAREAQRAAGTEELQFLTVIPFRGNDADRVLMTVTSNEGEKLTPLECGEVAKRLLRMHWDKPRIAERLNFTASWLDRILFLADMPEAVKHLVNHGRVAADVALKVVKTVGMDDAEAELLKMISAVEEKAKAKGKEGPAKVTKKDLKAETAPKPEKAPQTPPFEAEATSEDPAEPEQANEQSAQQVEPGPGPEERGQTLPPKKGRKVIDPVEVAGRLAKALPEFDIEQSTILDAWEYDIKVNGKVLRALLELQAALKGAASE